MEETVVDPHVHHSLESENDSLRKLIFWILLVIGSINCFFLWVAFKVRGDIELALESMLPGQPLPGLTRWILDSTPGHMPALFVTAATFAFCLVMIRKRFWKAVWPSLILIIVMTLMGWIILMGFYFPYIGIHTSLGRQ